MKLQALHDPQDCPHCGESISPILDGRSARSIDGQHTVYVSSATCPKCSGRWQTQLNEGFDE